MRPPQLAQRAPLAYFRQIDDERTVEEQSAGPPSGWEITQLDTRKLQGKDRNETIPRRSMLTIVNIFQNPPPDATARERP